ncbi:MAG: non-canonical purine NTP pyrophosphatase [bacterium]|nr:non-canonical purine NTP pyrophosphatase [bacterium]
MKTIRFATTNRGKAESMRKVLAPYDIELLQVDIELPEFRTADIRMIAEGKVRFAHEQINMPVIAQDSGFLIFSLNGFPGSFVKFVLETIGLEGLLELMRDKPRQCEFREALAYWDGGEDGPIFFEDVIPGFLTEKPRGDLPRDAWSALWLLFIPEGQKKTLAEMTPEERNQWRDAHARGSEGKFADWIAERKG